MTSSEPFAAVPETRMVDMLSGRVGAPDEEVEEKEEQLRWTGAWW
jgi:hypothetical protein